MMNGAHGTQRTIPTLALALSALVSMTGCDQSGDHGRDDGIRMRQGVGTGAGLTLNTNQWVSSSARDVYEFSPEDGWRANSFGYETQLKTLSLPTTPYGPVSSPVQSPPPSGQARVSMQPGTGLAIRVEGPNPGDPVHVLEGAALVGLRLVYDVRGVEGNDPHVVAIEVGDHLEVTGVGDLYEFHKVHPGSGDPIAPLCEQDADGLRMALVYDGLSVDGRTGTMTFTGQGVRHIACTSSAPGKVAQFGYAYDAIDPDTFTLANRVVRADYCADGYPYTYPGNLLGIADNVSVGQEGTTLADVQAALPPEESIEAVWDEHGVLCVGYPRATNVEREDIVCPTKRFADGTTVYNWRPPSCQGWVDQDPTALRMFSTTAP